MRFIYFGYPIFLQTVKFQVGLLEFVKVIAAWNKAKAINANLLAFVFDLEETFSFGDFKF